MRDVLKSKLDREIAVKVRQLESGSAQDYAMYRIIVAEIAVMKAMHQWIDDAESYEDGD